LTTGGFGFKTGTPIQQAFPSNPKDRDGWSMNSYSIDPFFKERTISATAHDSIQFNTSFTLDIAHTFHREEGSNYLENVDYALERIPDLQAIYNGKFEDACLTSNTEQENKKDLSYQAYPNPTNGQIQLRLPADLQGQLLKIKVYNLMGKLIWQENRRESEEITIDLPNNLPDGLYLLKANTACQSFTIKIRKVQ